MSSFEQPPDVTSPQASAMTLLRRAIKRARASLFWERLWPLVAALLTAIGLFLAFSWAGLWLALSPLGRAIALSVFGLLVLAAIVPLLLVRFPSLYEGLRRIDRNSGQQHRPATAMADEIAANGQDPIARALWQAHIERALLASRRLKAGWPSPRLALRDPMAFRALVLLLVVVSFFAASGERWKRVTAAFDWQGVIAPANFRIDAWVNPPLYTGRPPVMLPGARPGDTQQTANAPVAVPAGSQLIVRATGKVSFDIVSRGGVEAASGAGSALPAGAEERRFLIKGDGSASVQGVSRNGLTWNFTAIPDRAPNIALTREPERQARGALRLDYRMEDDYGVTDAKAIFSRKNEPGKAGAATPRPLFEAPQLNLVLPQQRARNGVAQTIHDFSEHPWAGGDVDLTLTARDEAGNEGRSESREIFLPQRVFVKPMARALVEQRRILALDANAKPVVLTALDALSMAPDKFKIETNIYLGLRSIYFDLSGAKTDDRLRDVVARLWAMAIQIEDGSLSDVEQALRQAQEALRQALERGATDEELKKLMDQLRAAMDRFLQQLVQEMQKNPQQLSRPLDRNSRTLTQQDLKSMLDRMEQLARSGNRDAARRLLEELQSMLENLQTAQPGGEMGEEDDMMSQLDELGDMIRKQQQLRDRTFREGQDQRRNRQRGERGQNQMGDLQQDQQQLKERLNKLLDQLRKRGMGQNQQGQQQQQGQRGQRGERGQQGQQGQQGDGMDQLGEAGDAMGDAEGQLGQGNADSAVDSQGRALEAMRKGAQGMAQSMQQQQGQMGPGPNGRPGRGQQRANRDTDPLGRPLRGREYGDDTTVKVPGEIDAQRARRVLEELRRRFADPARPQLELDYIERLLQGF